MEIQKVHTQNHLYLIVFLSCLAVSCTQAGIVMYTPSIPSLIKIFNTGYTEIAYTLTTYLLGYAISVLFFGGVSDQLGIKKSYLVTIAIFTISSIVLVFTYSIHAFILLRFLQGIGGGGCAVIARTSVRDRLDGKKLVSAMSYISISFIVALGLFQYLGGILQTYGNYRYDFIFMSMFGSIFFLLVIFLFHETCRESKIKFKFTRLIKNYCEIIKSNYLIPIAFGGGIGYSILLAFNILGIYYLQVHLKTTPHQIGIIGISFSVAYLLGSLFVNIVIKKLELNLLITTGKTIIFFSGIFSIVGLSLYKNSLILILLPLLTGLIGQAILYPCAMAKALEPYKKTPGAASSLFGFTQQFTGFLISMIVGWVPNQSILSLGIIIFIIGSITFLFLTRHFLHQKIETY